jgi:hypothetical protein
MIGKIKLFFIERPLKPKNIGFIICLLRKALRLRVIGYKFVKLSRRLIGFHPYHYSWDRMESLGPGNLKFKVSFIVLRRHNFRSFFLKLVLPCFII